jgi:hypothetical protein
VVTTLLQEVLTKVAQEAGVQVVQVVMQQHGLQAEVVQAHYGLLQVRIIQAVAVADHVETHPLLLQD